MNQDHDVNVIKQKKFFRKQTQQYRQRKCKYCDTTHQPRKCPAFGVQCSLCNKYILHPCVCLLSNRRNDHNRKQNYNRKSNLRSHTANFDNADKVRNMVSAINCMKSTTKTTTTIQVSVSIQIWTPVWKLRHRNSRCKSNWHQKRNSCNSCNWQHIVWPKSWLGCKVQRHFYRNSQVVSIV